MAINEQNLKVVIFGAGALGLRVLKDMRASKLEPIAFTDNNPKLWYTKVEGVIVVPPVEAVRNYKQGHLFVVAVYNRTPVEDQLINLGVDRFNSTPEFYRRYLPARLPLYCVEDSCEIDRYMEEVKACASLWDDEISQDTFNFLLQWHKDVSYRSHYVYPSPSCDTYFPPDLVKLREDEVFIDCGAYDGDTLRAFLYKTGGKFKGYWAFEPDYSSFAAMHLTWERLDKETQSKIWMDNVAVSNEDGKLQFIEDNSVRSCVIDPANEVVLTKQSIRCYRLDSLIQDTATYIKMDIEGHELQALEGARQTISKHRPVLAICLYHRMTDLWQIPTLIKQICPSYKMFLRLYAEDCWESVCYAIPEDRLLV
ncbi:FkbM family methyltransferase [Candidatus Pacearchaeota archaeon]|jgi:FkbM family methyltransferase|nr:FkbM family methyltransferase [Candidatus Pacearchaeota archaeon]